jgi:hypothetical protein
VISTRSALHRSPPIAASVKSPVSVTSSIRTEPAAVVLIPNGALPSPVTLLRRTTTSGASTTMPPRTSQPSSTAPGATTVSGSLRHSRSPPGTPTLPRSGAR